MVDKATCDAALKAFKKRLKAYQNDAPGSSGPASHLKGQSQITAIQGLNSYPQEVWEALVAAGRLRKVGPNLFELMQ